MNPTIIITRHPWERCTRAVAIFAHEGPRHKARYWSEESDGLGRTEAIERICDYLPDPIITKICPTCEGDPVDPVTGSICTDCDGQCVYTVKDRRPRP